MSLVTKPDKFSQQVRALVVGALALGLGLAFSAPMSYMFVLHDKTETIPVALQTLLLVLYALLFFLLACAVVTIWDSDYSLVRVF
jgi:hypothetical protein